MQPFDPTLYLHDSAELTDTEIDLRDSFANWLPHEVIDAHAHANTQAHIIGFDPMVLNHMYSSFPYYTLEQSRTYKALFFPNTQFRTLHFPHAFRGIDHRQANAYLLEQSNIEDRIAVYGLPEDLAYTEAIMHHPRASALKMYYAYQRPFAHSVYACFPREVCEIAQSMDMPIILHVPRPLVECVGQLVQLAQDFPKLRVCIPHVGSSKCMQQHLAEAFAALAKCGQFAMDTSLNPSADVLFEAMKAFGTERILFGTDEPLHLLRTGVYMHPSLGQRLYADYRYHWLDPDEKRFYPAHEPLVHAMWLHLLALREAIERIAGANTANTKELIFFQNAKAFYGF